MYGNGIVGLTESIYALASVHLVTALFGVQFWNARVAAIPGIGAVVAAFASVAKSLKWTWAVPMIASTRVGVFAKPRQCRSRLASVAAA